MERREGKELFPWRARSNVFLNSRLTQRTRRCTVIARDRAARANARRRFIAAFREARAASFLPHRIQHSYWPRDPGGKIWPRYWPRRCVANMKGKSFKVRRSSSDACDRFVQRHLAVVFRLFCCTRDS